MFKFEMNGIAYETDKETLDVLRDQVRQGNKDCITAIMTLGQMGGRIKELGPILV